MSTDSKNFGTADIAELFQKGLHHYQEGRLQQAQDICHSILKKQRHPTATLILGMIAHQKSEYEAATKHYQTFLEIKPNHAQAQYNLGIVLKELGRTELGIEHFKKSITIAADNIEVHKHLADAYITLQRWEEAIDTYQQVLAIQGEDVGTIIKIGNVFLAAQLWTNAIPRYEQALALQPDNAEVHKNLGSALHKLGKWQEALMCFEQALSLRPDYIDAHIELATLLRQLGRTEDALGQLELAIAFKPDDVDAHINLADTLRDLGQAELAIERLEYFLSVRPNSGSVYYHISLIEPKQELIPAVEELIGDPELPSDDVISCHFALGNFLKYGKSFDQAFGHFLTANTLYRETFTYDADENSRMVDSLIKVYSKPYFQSTRQFGSASLLPVFILGMPRSGTTLVEQILSSHALVHGAGELGAMTSVNVSIAQQLKNGSTFPECMSLIDADIADDYSAQYLQELALHCPTAERIIDKLTENFLRIGLIKTLFPDARIIHCQRSPLDNCISLFFHYFIGIKCSFEMTELGRYYLDYQRLMSHWHALFPGEIFTVQYEDLVTDQEAVSKQLVDYIGLCWDENCLNFHNNERAVMTASNIQVRQPMYKDSINRWQRYEKHLQPLIEMLP